MTRTLPKNVLSYIAFFALAITVGALESIHVQYQARRYVDPMDTADAVIVYILPSLVLMLGAMKLPSVGSERVADRVQDKRENLIVETPAEHRAEHAGPLTTRPARLNVPDEFPSSADPATAPPSPGPAAVHPDVP